MSEMVETVKDSVSSIFKGGGDKKKKLLIFGGIGAAVVGLALYMRSRGGDTGGAVSDAAGIGDDTSGSGSSGAADLSGLIEGFGGEIDRLDARIANLGSTGTNYTTTTPSPAPAPNLDNLAAYAPVADEPMVSTASPLTADVVPAVADVIPTSSVLPQTVAPAPAPAKTPAPTRQTVSAYAPAPTSSSLVIAPRPVNYTPYIAIAPAKSAYKPIDSQAAYDAYKVNLPPVAAPAKSPIINSQSAYKPIDSQAAYDAYKVNLPPVASPAPVIKPAVAPVTGGGAITLKMPVVAAPVIKPAVAPVTGGGAITLKKPVVAAPAKSPIINSQSAYKAIDSQAAYDAYMRTR